MIKKFLAVMFLGIVFVSKLFSQSNAECFSCHDDKTLTMERHGKIISLYVDPKKFENSTHGALSCVDCHIGFNPEEIPHKGKIEPVDCSPCHSMEVSGFKSSKHSLKLKCASCHGGIHEIVKVSRDIFVNKCSSCHKKEFEDFRTSVHFSFNKGADCIACHGSHSIKFASSDRLLSKPYAPYDNPSN